MRWAAQLLCRVHALAGTIAARVSPYTFSLPSLRLSVIQHTEGSSAHAGRERMQKIVANTQGFLYLVSVTGVTGARSEVSARVESLVKEIKAETDKPVCVGFGVSTAAHAKQLQGWGADGVIVGSALVKLLANGGVEEMKQLAGDMRAALDQ